MRTDDLPQATDEGTGDAVVLLHAFPLDGRMWESTRRALSRRLRVLAPDLRGFGRSAACTPPESLDAHADDVARLLDARKIERAALVGLSMGGYAALAFAARHGDRLSRLVLADTRANADSPEGRAGRDVNRALVAEQGCAALVEKMLPALVAPGAADAVRERVRALGGSQTPDGVRAALAAMRDRADHTATLRGVRVPTLVIVGELDALAPPDVARAMAEALPQGELTVLAGVGHLANLEAPAAFDAALEAFLTRGAREPLTSP